MSRLILVDDDDLVRASTGLYLEGAGWTVALAENGEQALALAATPFDVMICDLHLTPRRGGEGLAVLAAARLAAPRAILVLLSGGGAPESGDVVADAVLEKPMRMSALQRTLTELVARRG